MKSPYYFQPGKFDFKYKASYLLDLRDFAFGLIENFSETQQHRFLTITSPCLNSKFSLFSVGLLGLNAFLKDPDHLGAFYLRVIHVA